MLNQLLDEIRAGGTLEAAALAARLNTSPQMVAALLEHLRRAGYLQDYETCADACDGCGLKGQCDPRKKGASVRLWKYEG
jgi:hypothetical protein